MKKFYTWGNGPASSELIANAESSVEAAQAAIATGFAWTDDSWAVEVEANEEEIEKATRFDQAIAGYCEALFEKDVQDAFFANETNKDARVNKITPENWLRSLEDMPSELEKDIAQYQRGVELLKNYRVVVTHAEVSQKVLPSIPEAVATVIIPSGYRATALTYRRAGLVPRRDNAAWFAELTLDEAAIHVAGIGYAEDMDGQPLNLTPRQWNPETGVLEFDDGRFIITVRFLPDGEVEFVGKN